MSAILLAYVSGAVDFSRALNPDAADAHFCALAGAVTWLSFITVC